MTLILSTRKNSSSPGPGGKTAPRPRIRRRPVGSGGGGGGGGSPGAIRRAWRPAGSTWPGGRRRVPPLCQPRSLLIRAEEAGDSAHVAAPCASCPGRPPVSALRCAGSWQLSGGSCGRPRPRPARRRQARLAVFPSGDTLIPLASRVDKQLKSRVFLE